MSQNQDAGQLDSSRRNRMTMSGVACDTLPDSTVAESRVADVINFSKLN
jgi:hypothetical protein